MISSRRHGSSISNWIPGGLDQKITRLAYTFELGLLPRHEHVPTMHHLDLIKGGTGFVGILPNVAVAQGFQIFFRETQIFPFPNDFEPGWHARNLATFGDGEERISGI